jgi:hypothetical protein
LRYQLLLFLTANIITSKQSSQDERKKVLKKQDTTPQHKAKQGSPKTEQKHNTKT